MAVAVSLSPAMGLDLPVAVNVSAQPAPLDVGQTADATTIDALTDGSRVAPCTMSGVATADAASDLLGTPTLSDAQRVYLDELGNRNGTFDVGDLLAMYRLNGLAVPPSLLQAAAAAPPRRIRERRP